MGKPDDFLHHPRRAAPTRPVAERVGDFRELALPRAPEDRRVQASRCMDCGIPFCHQGCPLGNPIPDFNDRVWRDRWQEAWALLTSTNNFPEFTGRVCPAPCESACVLAINDQAVTIEQIEREIAERAFAEGWEQPRPASERTGKSVAVVGSGPAGLAAAQQLVRAGHDVVVLERDDRAGGLLRYGIPDFKLDRAVLDRRLDQLEAEGVVFRCGVEVGHDVGWADLHAEHDAVLVTIGAGHPRDLDVPGRALSGVHFAMPFLTRQNRRVAGDRVEIPPEAKGRHVIVLGGGDTGSDCLGTSLRQGAASVRQVEILPRPPEDAPPGMAWPERPVVFRTSSSQEEGGERVFAHMTTRLEGDEDGQLRRLHAVQVRPVGGRLEVVPGTEVAWDCDLLLLAMGFLHPVTGPLVEALGVDLTPRGNIATRSFRTSVSGVYAAGDASRGASLVVWAISDGREAARIIDADLCGRARLASRGQDYPVTVRPGA